MTWVSTTNWAASRVHPRLTHLVTATGRRVKVCDVSLVLRKTRNARAHRLGRHEELHLRETLSVEQMKSLCSTRSEINYLNVSTCQAHPLRRRK